MPSRADFTSQTAEPQTPDERRAWVQARAAEAAALGATLSRVSTQVIDGQEVVLFEAWLHAPADMGEPDFQLVSP